MVNAKEIMRELLKNANYVPMEAPIESLRPEVTYSCLAIPRWAFKIEDKIIKKPAFLIIVLLGGDIEVVRSELHFALKEDTTHRVDLKENLHNSDCLEKLTKFIEQDEH